MGREKKIIIRNDSNAAAYLRSMDHEVPFGPAIVWDCRNCGGSGSIGYRYPQPCPSCRGAGSWTVSLKEYAQHMKRLDAYAAKAASKAEEGQRNWNEAHGYGRKTFAERDAERAEAAKKVKRQQAASEWLGEVKERLELELTVVHVAHWDGYGYYDTVHCYVMVDDEGNTVVWKANNTHLEINHEPERGWCLQWVTQAEKGDRVRIKATVKAHTTRNGCKQTVVQRAKALEIVKAEALAA